MRYRKALLQLPKDHCWGEEEWRDFEVLNSYAMARELKAHWHEVDSVLYVRKEDWYTQEALPFSDADL